MRTIRNRRGAVAAMSAVVMIAVVGFAGLAIDLTRIWMVNARLKTAIDAAALVAARLIDAPTRDAEARRLYWANFTQNGRTPNYLGSTLAQATITPFANADPLLPPTRIQVTGQATVNTTLFGVISRQATVLTDSAIAERQGTGLELALVLDVTGSMAANNNIGALRTSATELIDILYAGQERQPNLWVSVVPYTAMVNIGRGREAWLQAGSLNPADFQPTVWRGCVEARAGVNYPAGADEDDSPPSLAPFRPHFWPSNRYEFSLDPAIPGNVWVYRGNAVTSPRLSVPLVGGVAPNALLATDFPVNRGDNAWIPGPGGTVVSGNTAAWSDAVWEPDPENPAADEAPGGLDNDRRGPNLGCGRAVLPLTRDRTPIIAQINALRATRRGGTMANVGLQLGWGTISPRWRADWNLAEQREGQQLPLDYNTRFMRKAIVLMTDGENQWFDWNGGAPGACTVGHNRCTSTTVPARPPNVPVLVNPPTNADQNAYGRLANGGPLGNRLGILNPTPGANGTAATDPVNGINARMARLCAAVQADNRNITVYTIVFGNVNTTTQDLYRNCASAPGNFFLAPTQAELAGAFRAIAGQLANLRLAQ